MTGPPVFPRRDPLPWEAGFLAGKGFVKYRRSGGKRHSPLPDFYIGAHAAIQGIALLTRDTNRYKTYFPKLRLISRLDISAPGAVVQGTERRSVQTASLGQAQHPRIDEVEPTVVIIVYRTSKIEKYWR